MLIDIVTQCFNGVFPTNAMVAKTTFLTTLAIVVATASMIAASGVATPALATSNGHHHHNNNNHNHNDLKHFFDCVRHHGGKDISKRELNRCFNRFLSN
jgi:hypothetical protein